MEEMRPDKLQKKQNKKIYLLNYVGSKFKLVNWFLENIPEHRTYVEVFGGSLSLFLNKPLAEINVVNDINNEIIRVYKSFQDDNEFKEILKKTILSPYSRKEFIDIVEAKKSLEPYEVIIKYNHSFSGGRISWSFNKCDFRRSRLSACLNRMPVFVEISNKLKNAVVENLDFREVIKKYDDYDTFFYLDPPYLHSKRRSTSSGCRYDYEMIEEEHREMVEILLNIKGLCMLSGYDNEIYRTLENYGWIKKTKKVAICSKRDVSKKREKGVECIWMNYKT